MYRSSMVPTLQHVHINKIIVIFHSILAIHDIATITVFTRQYKIS